MEGDRPQSDPTALTTEALAREIAHVKELFQCEMAALGVLTDQRFAHMESVRLELKADVKRELDAAFMAAKEAVAKTEAAVDTRILRMGESFNGTTEELRRGLNDSKDRLAAATAALSAQHDAAVKTIDDKIAVLGQQINDVKAVTG